MLWVCGGTIHSITSRRAARSHGHLILTEQQGGEEPCLEWVWGVLSSEGSALPGRALGVWSSPCSSARSALLLLPRCSSMEPVGLGQGSSGTGVVWL